MVFWNTRFSPEKKHQVGWTPSKPPNPGVKNLAKLCGTTDLKHGHAWKKPKGRSLTSMFFFKTPKIRIQALCNHVVCLDCHFFIHQALLSILNTVGGRNPAPVDIVKDPVIRKVLYIPVGAGFLPSTVSFLFHNLETSSHTLWVSVFRVSLWFQWYLLKKLLGCQCTAKTQKMHPPKLT